MSHEVGLVGKAGVEGEGSLVGELVEREGGGGVAVVLAGGILHHEDHQQGDTHH